MTSISFDDVEQLFNRRASQGIRPGLDRIGHLLSLLGNPEGTCPSVHVVGTNGKGSTCAFLDSVFRAAGYRTALYTSPHLESPGERLLIDGSPLSPSRWMTAAQAVTEKLSDDNFLRDDPPSYFELVTASAFWLMRDESADFAVVEAGLGGRLDATNLLSDVACSVVASVSMDHTEYLGTTIEKIAAEKFAVVRARVPACYLGDSRALIPLFREFCARAGALPSIVAEDVKLSNVQVSEDGCVFGFSAPGLELKEVRTGLIGSYQVANASLAMLAVSCMSEKFPRLTEEAIREGMKNAIWPGRLEILRRAPSPLLVLDGGHNIDGVTKLSESVSTLWRDKKIGVVYGVMKDKDYPACLAVLNGISKTTAFYPTCVPGMERSLKATALAEAALKFEWRNKTEGQIAAFDNPLDAINRALDKSEGNDVVLVCGSLYLIGHVRGALASQLS
ncbi:bifunctional folylpolyglutamate synthase/dihydrofolate synthase [Synergistales bacterium]|nr:bifunctional folylpolyglutamate synthase/dihydrofolate synthase [Synergistales bacterium]